jgi:hypothetical protein
MFCLTFFCWCLAIIPTKKSAGRRGKKKVIIEFSFSSLHQVCQESPNHRLSHIQMLILVLIKYLIPFKQLSRKIYDDMIYKLWWWFLFSLVSSAHGLVWIDGWLAHVCRNFNWDCMKDWNIVRGWWCRKFQHCV